jgi:hypothetical protein
MNKIWKEHIVKIKKVLKSANKASEVYEYLENNYERISNQPEKNYNERYNVVDIFKGKTFKEMVKKLSDRTVYFEFVKFDNAPNGFVIIYNTFELDSQFQDDIDIFVMENSN